MLMRKEEGQNLPSLSTNKIWWRIRAIFDRDRFYHGGGEENQGSLKWKYQNCETVVQTIAFCEF